MAFPMAGPYNQIKVDPREMMSKSFRLEPALAGI